MLCYSLLCGGDFIHQLVELCTAAIPLNREEVITGYVHLVLLMCDRTICWVHSVCGAEHFFLLRES